MHGFKDPATSLIIARAHTLPELLRKVCSCRTTTAVLVNRVWDLKKDPLSSRRISGTIPGRPY